MKKIILESQDETAETLLTALYIRAREASRPNPLLCDEWAVHLVEQIDYDFTRFQLNKLDQVTAILRVREFDNQTREYLSHHAGCVVINLGCGLDTRFERVDNGMVEWYNLDLPEVIEFRKKLIAETPRCTSLGYSVFDPTWLEAVSGQPGKPYLFIAEGILPYFTEQQVKDLFLLLRNKFPGCEIVCDGMAPLMQRIHNLELTRSKVTARLNWGLKNGRQPETWGAGIRLISEWFYFDRPEPRLGLLRLMRYIPPLARGVGIFHYQLGEVTA